MKNYRCDECGKLGMYFYVYGPDGTIPRRNNPEVRCKCERHKLLDRKLFEEITKDEAVAWLVMEDGFIREFDVNGL